jgi:uncharacterized RDD family membrane protein YckC
MHWYYAIDGQQLGPVEEPEFERLVSIGVISSQTLVWRNGMSNWQPYGDVFVAAGAATHGGQSEPVAMPQRVPGVPVARVHYAGFWIRFAARLIDGIILGIAGLILRIPLFLMLGLRAAAGFNPMMMGPQMAGGLGLTILINTAIAVAYEVYFVSSRGATPGKMAMGIKIVMSNGSPVPPGVAAGRYFAQWISAMILLIGYLMAAFDYQKRALHDRICGTRLIHAR